MPQIPGWETQGPLDAEGLCWPEGHGRAINRLTKKLHESTRLMPKYGARLTQSTLEKEGVAVRVGGQVVDALRLMCWPAIPVQTGRTENSPET